jgi:hypothetical protein
LYSVDTSAETMGHRFGGRGVFVSQLNQLAIALGQLPQTVAQRIAKRIQLRRRAADALVESLQDLVAELDVLMTLLLAMIHDPIPCHTQRPRGEVCPRLECVKLGPKGHGGFLEQVFRLRPLRNQRQDEPEDPPFIGLIQPQKLASP